MALDKTQLLADVRNIIADDPVTVVHQGDTFTARKSAKRSGVTYTEFGQANDALEFSIIAPVADFNTTPAKGQDITIAGARYNIERVDTLHADVMHRIVVSPSYEAVS